MKDIYVRKLFRTKKSINIYKLDNEEYSEDKAQNAATWNQKICQGKLQLYQNQYGQLNLCLLSKNGQPIIENQFLKEDISKKILICKDTCRGYQIQVLSPNGSLNMKLGILFDTRTESLDFSTILGQFCDQLN